MRRGWVGIAGSITAMAACTLITGCPEDGGGSQQNNFSATLSGGNEVPPVTTAATGSFTAEITEDDQAIDFRLEAQNITNVTAAHIHVGAVGTNGPIIFFLITPGEPFTSPVTGTLRASDLTSANGVNTFAEALAAIRAGNTYANVHTQANSGGEIRGQITPSNP